MRIVSRSLWPALLALMVLAGCSDSPNGNNGARTKDTKANPKSAPERKVEEIRPVTYAGFEAELAKLKGKVVVVDFWAFY